MKNKPKNSKMFKSIGPISTLTCEPIQFQFRNENFIIDYSEAAAQIFKLNYMAPPAIRQSIRRIGRKGK